MTLAEWAIRLGFYAPEETQDPRFYTDAVEAKPQHLVQWWPTISDHTWAGAIRASWLRDPLHRYLHRCIARTIAGRHATQEQVTLHDMLYLRSLLSPSRANLAYCVAVYSAWLHMMKIDSPITCGAYITVLARHLGLYTDEILHRHTRDYPPTFIGRSTVTAMRIAHDIDGHLRWSLDEGLTIWQPRVERAEHPPP